jgi:hypothetical protein
MAKLRDALPEMAEDGSPVRYADVPGNPNYFVGTDGSIWSRQSYFGRPPTGYRRLRPTRHGSGYLTAIIRPPGQRFIGGKGAAMYVHRIVLEAFVGPCPTGMVACHADDVKADNRLENLRWDTQSANCHDAVRNGNLPRGSQKSQAKLKEDDIPLIRYLARRGFSQERIGTLFGVRQGIIWGILNGRRWAHVPEQEVIINSEAPEESLA